MKDDEGWWRVDLRPSPSEPPVFIGFPHEKMKGEGFLRNPLKKLIPTKVLSYGTKVPYLEHFCAITKHLYRKGK